MSQMREWDFPVAVGGYFLRSESNREVYSYCVGPASLVWSHVPVVGWVASTCVHGLPLGAFSIAGVVKSKNSLMSRVGSQ